MPTIIHPLIKLTLTVIGAAAAVHWVVKEVRRVNAELEALRRAPVGDRAQRAAMPTLRRDPVTGEYRPM